MTRPGPGDERGIALVEALVALLVVGVTIIGSHSVLRAALRAQVRAESAFTAVADAAAEAERVRAGVLPVSAALASDTTTVWAPVRCWATPRIRHVTVRDATGAVALRVAARTAGFAPVLALETSDGAPLAGAEVVIRTPTEERVTVVTDAMGCVEVPTGNLRIDAVAGTRPTSTPRPLSTPGAVPGLPVVIASAGVVRVLIESDGRSPDAIAGGEFAWWDPDDPEGRIAAPGTSLSLESGTRRIVVGACADVRADGTAASIEVAPGGELEFAATLGSVAIAGAPPDVRRLVLRSARPCPGPQDRPELTWDLEDGAIVGAVPDGVWEATLTDAEDRAIAGPVTVVIAGPVRVAPVWP